MKLTGLHKKGNGPMNNTTVWCFFTTVKARQKEEKSNEQCNRRLQYCNPCSWPDLTTSRQQQGVFLLEAQTEGKHSPCTQTGLKHAGFQLWLTLVQRRLVPKCWNAPSCFLLTMTSARHATQADGCWTSSSVWSWSSYCSCADQGAGLQTLTSFCWRKAGFTTLFTSGPAFFMLDSPD